MPAPAAASVGSASMKKNGADPIPVMDYRQYRRVRRLVHECCNYDGGHCIALDDGEECVCDVPLLLFIGQSAKPLPQTAFRNTIHPFQGRGRNRPDARARGPEA